MERCYSCHTTLEDSMTREQLIASLTANAHEGWYPGDDYDGRYIDWAIRTPDGGWRMEAGDGDEAVQLDMTRDEMVELHRALTITLLA